MWLCSGLGTNVYILSYYVAKISPVLSNGYPSPSSTFICATWTYVENSVREANLKPVTLFNTGGLYNSIHNCLFLFGWSLPIVSCSRTYVHQQDVMKLIKHAGILNFTAQLLSTLPQTCETTQPELPLTCMADIHAQTHRSHSQLISTQYKVF